MLLDARLVTCSLLVLCNIVRLIDAKRIAFNLEDFIAVDEEVKPPPRQPSHHHHSNSHHHNHSHHHGRRSSGTTELKESISTRRGPTDVEIILGSDHLDTIIDQVLLPWLDGLFKELHLPDIPIPLGVDTMMLQNLMITQLKMKNPTVSNPIPHHTNPTGDEIVTSFTLTAEADIVATSLFAFRGGDGDMGGKMVEFTIKDKIEIVVTLRKKDPILILSIASIRLLAEKGIAEYSYVCKTEKGIGSSTAASPLCNPVTEMIVKKILADALYDNWGKKPGLDFPLDVLLGIPLGPSATCIGSDFSEDGRIVNPPELGTSEQMCRPMLSVNIKLLTILSDKTVHLVVGLEPWVEVTQLRATDVPIRAGLFPKDYIGPMYKGMPMPFPTTDARFKDLAKPIRRFKDAIDACITVNHDWCKSVYAKLNEDKQFEYYLGRTAYPVLDAVNRRNDPWVKCADEGGKCYTTEDLKTKVEETELPQERIMILRFGEKDNFEKTYVERTVYDDGDGTTDKPNGVPCRRDLFGLGLQFPNATQRFLGNAAPGAAIGFEKKRICKRLTVPKEQAKKAVVAKSITCTGVYCALERPCAMVFATSKTPIKQFPKQKKGILVNDFCLEEGEDGSCPSIPPSEHCWKTESTQAQTSFTQPVHVAYRMKRSCSGDYHLPCWLDIQPGKAPPPLSMSGDLASVARDQIELSLPLSVLNSALAAIYTTGLLRAQVFGIQDMQSVGNLCAMSEKFLCIGKPYKDSDEIRLQLQPLSPPKVQEIDGEEGVLALSLALQLSVHVANKEEENWGLPVERMLSSKKKCVRKEGLLRVYWIDNPTRQTKMDVRWIELEKTLLKSYSIHGRRKIGDFHLGGKTGYSVEKDIKKPNERKTAHEECENCCFKLKRGKSYTYRFCAESPETASEWYTALTTKDSTMVACDTSAASTWGRAEAARVAFGAEVRVKIKIENNQFLCVLPLEGKRSFIIHHVGQLHTRTGLEAIMAKAVLGHSAAPFLQRIVDIFGLLTPTEVWDLKSLAPGAGMRTDPPPTFELRSGRIHLKAHIDYNQTQLERLRTRSIDFDSGFEIKTEVNDASNHCVAPGWKPPFEKSLLFKNLKRAKYVGSAAISPFKVITYLNPAKLLSLL